jgi:hypothetical protein
MEMINVLKRLAELDAANPNVQQVQRTKVSESTLVDECGMMASDMQPSSTPRTPASIHITANDGQELSGMLQDIVQLAGLKQQGVDNMGADDSQVLSTTPVVGISSPAANDMRAVIDKLNPDDMGSDDTDDVDAEPDDSGDEDDEEQLEAYDNSPSDPSSAQSYDADALAYHPNPPGAANGRGLTSNPRGVPTMEEVEQQLYSAYQRYLNEEN